MIVLDYIDETLIFDLQYSDLFLILLDSLICFFKFLFVNRMVNGTLFVHLL